jgi:hypothetical protein
MALVREIINGMTFGHCFAPALRVSYARRNQRLCVFIRWCLPLCLIMRKKENGHMTVFRVDLVPTPAIRLDLCY